jgi:lipoprotein-anchoring transpeptidase ErfK/SrfK
MIRILVPIGFAALLAAPAGAADFASLSLPREVPADIFASARSGDVLLAQVLLDRRHHSPGVIDGVMGANTRRAIRAFQKQSGMRADGRISAELLRKLVAQESGDIVRRYTITAEDVAGPFAPVPEGMAAKASGHVGYESPLEALAEKFHMSQGFLKALNPGARFDRAGEEIIVAVSGADQLGIEVTRIEVDKSASAVRAYGSDGSLVATYPATIGSSSFPSPSGSMEVRAVAPAPTYHFDPSGRAWGPDHALTIEAGPNNPVGSTWIDLTKDGYGIHGTPDPKLIGKTAATAASA